MVRDGLGHGHVKPRPDGDRARCGGPRMCPDCRAERDELTAEWNAAVEQARAEREALYTERAALVAHLATVHPAWMAEDADAPGWLVCTVATPAGQVGWHIAEHDVHLFAHVPRGGGPEYDGHTKRQALARLVDTTRMRAQSARAQESSP